MTNELNEAIRAQRETDEVLEQLATIRNTPVKEGTLEDRIAKAKTPGELDAVMAKAELEAAQAAVQAQLEELNLLPPPPAADDE